MMLKRFFFLLFTTCVVFTPLAAESNPVYTGWMAQSLENMLKNNQEVCCLGWSRESTCAVAEVVSGGLRGGYALRLMLLDTINDKIIFNDEVWTDEIEAASEEPHDIASAVAGSKTGRNFGNKCDSSGIEGNLQNIQTFPLNHKGIIITASFNSLKSKEALSEMEKEDSERGAKKLDIMVSVSKEGGGSKIITTLKGVTVSGFNIAGYFKSPLEPRILVIFDIFKPGFEGDTNRSYGYSGCFLEKGFK
jgi:hypothetical protein